MLSQSVSRAGFGAAIAVALVLGAGVAARGERTRRDGLDAPLRLPRVAEGPTLDGELSEPVWQERAWHSGAFFGDDGARTNPFSDVALAATNDVLLAGFYAADLDLRAHGDAAQVDRFWFEVRRGHSVAQAEIAPDGTLSARACAPGDVCAPLETLRRKLRVAHAVDGTIDRPNDLDEEWLLEIAAPFGALGLSDGGRTAFSLAFGRCDVVRSGARVCARFPAKGFLRAVVGER